MALPWITRPPFSRHGVLDRGAIRRFAESQIQASTSAPRDRRRAPARCPAEICRRRCWRASRRMSPSLLVAAQPTRGIDIGATESCTGSCSISARAAAACC